MAEIAGICIAAVIMAGVYSRTARPKLYAFFNTAAGVLSLIAEQVFLSGGLGGITPYNTALSVILGIPGTLLHRLICMI